jgi:hypothetical protein
MFSWLPPPPAKKAELSKKLGVAEKAACHYV